MSENEILADLIFEPDRGALRFNGVRYLLIRPETVASIQLQMEEEIGPERAGELLYAGGFTGGQLSGRRYKEQFGLTDRQAVKFMCQMGGQIGWGRFRLLELGAGKLSVAVDASPFAEAYGEGAAGPVCHLIRGVLGGLGSGIFAAAVQAHERQCLARGDERCLFEIMALA